MFYYLDGTVAEIAPYLAVIDCGGVGYACKTTNYTLSRLKKGQRGKLYTYLNVGDGIFELYGFATQNELSSFKLLIGVSGVGPKAALAILSTSSPEALAMAIVTGDEKALTAAPGIGKKIAQRIILELKDKMTKESAATGLDFSGSGAVMQNPFTSKATEAAAGPGGPGLHQCRGICRPEGRGCGKPASGGDHPPEPEEDGEVRWQQLERSLQGDFDDVLSRLHDGILSGSVSASYEDGSDYSAGGVRCAVRVYERYSMAGGNRVSLNLTLVGSGRELFLSAITSGGSQAMFFKINTWGEEAFLDRVRELIESL